MVKLSFFSVIQGTDSLVPEFSRYSSPLDRALQTVKNEGVRKPSVYWQLKFMMCRCWWKTFQVTGIFRGGFTTLLRESIGNAVFFSVYEYVRHYMHLQLKPTLSDRSNLVDMGIGIVTGGLGGVAVCIPKTLHIFWKKNLFDVFQEVINSFTFWCYPVLVCRFAFGCGENHYPDISW